MPKLVFLPLLLCFCFNTNAQAPPNKPPQCLNIPPIPKSPLGEVDRSFLDSYCALQLADFAHETPYVVVLGSRLTLRWGTESNKKPDEEKGIPDTYHALKDIAHVPFSVYLLLRPVEQGSLTFDQQKVSEDILSDGAAACIAKLPEKDRLYTDSSH